MSNPAVEARVAAVRRFNRFYTRRIGLLEDGYLDSAFSLTEARVLYELATRNGAGASEIAAELALDQGYLSRILRRFAAGGLIARKRDPADRRQIRLILTAKGRKAFAPLDRRSHDEIAALLGGLSNGAQNKVVDAMSVIQDSIAAAAPSRASEVVLRTHRPGDIGWIVSAHGRLYAKEYGWDIGFEALVAEIAAQFIRDYDPERERCWIAEKDGQPAGSVIIAKTSKNVAKLRLFIVEPSARGSGIGRRLVEEAIGFARGCGYDRITLWTQKNLEAARHIYRKTGFVLVAEEPHRSFGHDLVGETWELKL